MATNNTPQIRFKGFSDEWEQRKASNIFVSVSEKNNPELPVLSASQEKGMILRDTIGIDIKYDKKSLNTYKKVSPGQFVIHLRSFQGGFAYSEIEGITSPAYTVIDFKNKESYYPTFWRSILTSTTFIKKLETVTYGIRDGRSISFKDFSTLKFNVPKYNEQIKIGNFLNNLDDAIALHQRKLELLKEQKKGFLQKLFPKKGENIPEIRFKGFSEEWEEAKLGDLSEIKTGKLDANMQKENGKYPFFTSGEKVYKTDTYAFDGDAILIAGNGNVGLQHKFKGKFNAYQRTYVLMGFKAEKEVIYNQIALNLPHLLSKETRTGVIPYIVINMLKNLEIKLPKSKKEQELIGKVFLDLDTQISSLENKLDIYKQFKKAMLQKMFV